MEKRSRLAWLSSRWPGASTLSLALAPGHRSREQEEEEEEEETGGRERCLT